ncbi:hypothetical protein DMC30DRAFT_449775 [Rhodotorula diobovata]|uniref:Uncharacterized protein n=1 Tax=Rhodotorula diobovata TaxID=5288 RepID=A0A5C5FL01_9BASI|nr:hypothetical protein DMC30DRAFT_449775 [Rhodotorula diobovata]
MKGRHSATSVPLRQTAYQPLAQTPTYSPASLLRAEDEFSDEQVHEKRPRVIGGAWSRSRLRAVARFWFWLVLLAVLSLFALHRSLGSSAQRASPSPSSSPTEHDGFLNRLGLVDPPQHDDRLTSLVESRLNATAPLTPYRLLLGTVQRSEGAALVEWVLHHIALGVDHFVVYDASDPTDAAAAETRDRVLPLVELGWVTLVPIGGRPDTVFEGATRRFRSEWAAPKTGPIRARWSAFLDVNEVIVQLDEARPLPEMLDDGFSLVEGVELPRVWVTGSPDTPTSSRAGVIETHTALVSLENQDSFLTPRIISYTTDSSNEREHIVVDSSGDQSRTHRAGAAPREVAERYPLHLRRYVRPAKECRLSSEKQTVSDPALGALDQRACNARGAQGVEEDASLVPRGAQLSALVRRLEERWPLFDQSDFRLSVLPSSSSSSRRVPLPRDRRVTAGATLVVDSERSDVGHLEVLLSTGDTKRYLPVTYRSDGGAAFTLPPATSAELLAGAGTATLNITRQYVSSPSPEMDPLSPCPIMSHLKNQPTRAQLLALRDGECKGVDEASSFELAVKTWPHSRWRGENVLSQALQLSPSVDNPPAPDQAFESLAEGHWARHSLQSLVAAGDSEEDQQTRLYTPAACPRPFSAAYWDAPCGTDERLEREGVLRWVPDGASSYLDVSLRKSELRSCLHADATVPAERRRILVIGDSVASHTFMGLQCLSQHLGIADSKQHVRFHSLQYEALDLAAGSMTRNVWDRFLAWEWDDRVDRAKSYPHVVVLNIGLWSAQYTRAEDYAAGLRDALEHLTALAYPDNPDGPRILWRETTPAFNPKSADPLWQINPRVRLFNSLAAREVAAARAEGSSIDVLEAYNMVSARGDSARDAVHLCPVVHGDLVETLMHRICRDKLLER